MNKIIDFEAAKEKAFEKECFGFYDDETPTVSWWCLGCLVKKECLEERNRKEWECEE